MPETSQSATRVDYVYRDKDIVAVNKPAGLLAVPGLCEPDNLYDRVLNDHANARVVHRLDMATSGLMLFALNHTTQKALGQLFERRLVTKQYVAVLEGRVNSDCGELHSPLRCDWPRRPRQIIDWHTGKAASTWFAVTERRSGSTRVNLKPYTGRTHQLRVHMCQLGHPILGDRLYHDQGEQCERMYLHAERLEFIHPSTQQHLSLCCPAAF